MQQVVSVRLRYNPKPLWFDPQGQSFLYGSEVLVETERGREVGVIIDPAIEAGETDIAKLKTPLKPVVRELTDLDYEHLEVLEERGRTAMPVFREKVAEYELDIKPVEVQYLFSGERAVFYFSSEERVDFRELVRDLAQYFHVRIDMRQIGARDEAKELGGIAHCGEEFCCTRFGGEFQPVSIRMAKEQDLPLNPSKISGVCGRLMCCLRYEYEAYKDFKKRAPKKGTPVDTPLGEAVISGYNTPSEMMELRLEDGKRLNVPLAEMNCQKGKDGCSRCSVDHETIERCASQSILIALGSFDQRLGDSLSAGTSAEDTEEYLPPVKTVQEERKRRRRSGSAKQEAAQSQSAKRTRGAASKEARDARALRNYSSTQAVSSSDAALLFEEEESSGSRRKRRRGASNKSASGASGAAAKAAASSGNRANNGSDTGSGSSGSGEKRPRPGQRSSGLRRKHAKSTGAADKQAEDSAAHSARERSSRQGAPQHASKPFDDVSSTNLRRRRRSGRGNSTGDSAADAASQDG